MSQLSSIKYFTEILNKLKFHNQDEDTKNKLQAAVSSVIKQAQDRCLLTMMKMNINDNICKDALKEQARELIHNELQELIKGKDFLTTCQNIIADKHNPLFPFYSKDFNNKPNNNKLETQLDLLKYKSSRCINQKDLDAGNQQLKPIFENIRKRLNSEHYQHQNINVENVVYYNDIKKSTNTVTHIRKQIAKDPERPFENKSSKLITNKLDIKLSKTTQNNTKLSQKQSKQKLTISQKTSKTSLSNSSRTKSASPKTSEKSLNSINKKTKPTLSKISQKSSGNLKRKISNPQITTTSIIFNKPKPNSPQRMSQNSLGTRTSKTYVPSSLSIQIIQSLNCSELSKFQKVKETVEIAIRHRKTFIMLTHGLIRRSLLERGWVEKIVINRYHSTFQQTADRMSISELFHNIDDSVHDYFYLRLLKSKLLGSNTCDLMWGSRGVTTSMAKCTRKQVWLNHFSQRGQPDFNSKVGLCQHMRNLRWNYRQDIADVYFPRTYILHDNEWDDFIYDFRITACLALLKWSIYRASAHQPLISKSGKVPIDAFFFAILQCIGFVKRCKDCESKLSYSQQTWNDFVDHYYQCIYKGEHFCCTEQDNVTDMVTQASQVLERVKTYRPELDYDGNHNIWILKPNNWSQGQGIRICRQMNHIKELSSKSPHLHYVVQKYIEKPLLIYNTKFDIRQWFLISCSVPLTVWIYKDSYLRFSSQQYDLTRFHESIHLTNNSVQRKYKNNSMRNSQLPKDNMWDSNQFQHYLKTIGQGDVWTNSIYPKIKQAIVAVLLSAKDGIEDRPRTFELFGADFMLTPDFQPWLIEINSCPAMLPSTSVTAKMCPQVNEDMIKVVIDGSNAPNCNKGKFELIYRDKVLSKKLPTIPKISFFLKGTPLSLTYYKLIDETKKIQNDMCKNTQSSLLLSLPDLNKFLKKSVSWIQPVLSSNTNLNEEINMPGHMEQEIKTTNKIVHMQSLLNSIKPFLEKKMIIKQKLTQNEKSIDNQIVPYFKQFYQERNIEDIIDDIEKSITTMSQLSSDDLEKYQSNFKSVLCQKTLLQPKTLKNIILILTHMLYLKSTAQITNKLPNK